MKYACVVYVDEKQLGAFPKSELDAILAEVTAWEEELRKSERHVLTAGFQPVRTATNLRSRNGNLSVTDGPHGRSSEQLGGFTVIEAKDLNEAIRWASKSPCVRLGRVEVRPLALSGGSTALGAL